MVKSTPGSAPEVQPAHKSQPLAVGIPEAVELTGLSRSRLYSELREGRLKARKSGRRTLIAFSELSRWLHSLPTT